MIKPDCYQHIGKILDIIEQSGFVVGNIRMAKMTVADTEEFYAEHKVTIYYPSKA
jgi:nucleoside diphosphate kinase